MAKAELFQKDIPAEERVFYYASEEDDPIKTDEQEKKVEVGLPEGYEFIPKNSFVKLYSAALFRRTTSPQSRRVSLIPYRGDLWQVIP